MSPYLISVCVLNLHLKVQIHIFTINFKGRFWINTCMIKISAECCPIFNGLTLTFSPVAYTETISSRLVETM